MSNKLFSGRYLPSEPNRLDRFTLRLDANLIRIYKEIAQQRGIGLNALIAEAMAQVHGEPALPDSAPTVVRNVAIPTSPQN